MKLVVTIPALNEEKTIAQVVRGVPRDIPGVQETEVIVVNDGSTDRTAPAAYRLTLFGRYTYTQETFIDLFSTGVRMAEVPLKVRGVREYGKSRVASSIW